MIRNNRQLVLLWLGVLLYATGLGRAIHHVVDHGCGHTHGCSVSAADWTAQGIPSGAGCCGHSHGPAAPVEDEEDSEPGEPGAPHPHDECETCAVLAATKAAPPAALPTIVHSGPAITIRGAESVRCAHRRSLRLAEPRGPPRTA